MSFTSTVPTTPYQASFSNGTIVIHKSVIVPKSPTEFHHPSNPLQVKYMYLLNQVIQVILLLNIRTPMSKICDYMYLIINPHPVIL